MLFLRRILSEEPSAVSVKGKMSSEPLRVGIATESDHNDIMTFLLSDFVFREPMNEALDLKVDDCKEFFTYLVQKGINSKLSNVMRNEKGEVIAVILSSFIYRPIENNNEPSSEEAPLNEKIMKITRLLEKLDENIWTGVPSDVSKLYYVIIVSVASNYGRRGIAQRLLELGMSQGKSAGCQGLLAEATALNSQKLFAKLNCQVIAEIRHSDYKDEKGERILKCKDSTESAQLVFKRI